MSLKIILLKLLSHLQGPNETKSNIWKVVYMIICCTCLYVHWCHIYHVVRWTIIYLYVILQQLTLMSEQNGYHFAENTFKFNFRDIKFVFVDSNLKLWSSRFTATCIESSPDDQWVNSLFPSRCINIFKNTSISYTFSVKFHWDVDDLKSTLIQVMAWCHQATSHYLSQCWPRSMPP